MTELPIACSLDREGLEDRAATMVRLGEDLVALKVEGRTASLRFDTDEERIQEFVRAESSCCPFFEFSISRKAAEVELSVGVPSDAEWALRGLIAGFVAGWQGLL